MTFFYVGKGGNKRIGSLKNCIRTEAARKNLDINWKGQERRSKTRKARSRKSKNLRKNEKIRSLENN